MFRISKAPGPNKRSLALAASHRHRRPNPPRGRADSDSRDGRLSRCLWEPRLRRVRGSGGSLGRPCLLASGGRRAALRDHTAFRRAQWRAECHEHRITFWYCGAIEELERMIERRGALVVRYHGHLLGEAPTGDRFPAVRAVHPVAAPWRHDPVGGRRRPFSPSATQARGRPAAYATNCPPPPYAGAACESRGASAFPVAIGMTSCSSDIVTSNEEFKSRSQRTPLARSRRSRSLTVA